MFRSFKKSALSKETIQKLNTQIQAVLNNQEFVNALAVSYLTPYPTTPNELGQQLKSDSAKWQKIVAEIGFTPED